MCGSKIVMLLDAITNAQSSRENIAMAAVCATAQTFVAASSKLRVLSRLFDTENRRGNEAS